MGLNALLYFVQKRCGNDHLYEESHTTDVRALITSPVCYHDSLGGDCALTFSLKHGT